MSDLLDSPDQRRRDYIVAALREAGAMYEGDARRYLAEHETAVRAELRAAIAADLGRIADRVERLVADRYGSASGIGPGSAEMVREAARTVNVFPLPGEKDSATPAPTEPLCQCGHYAKAHMHLQSYGGTGCLLCPVVRGDSTWRHPFTPAGAPEEKDSADPAPTSTPQPEFFQPGRTYTQGNNGYRAPELIPLFRVEHVTRHPERGHLRAIGWMRTSNPGARWHGHFQDEDEFDGWTETTPEATSA